MPHVMEPNHFAVGGVKKRHAKAVAGKFWLIDTFGVALGLGQHILRAQGQFLGFHHAQNLTIDTKLIIGRSIDSLKLFHCAAARAKGTPWPAAFGHRQSSRLLAVPLDD